MLTLLADYPVLRYLLIGGVAALVVRGIGVLMARTSATAAGFRSSIRPSPVLSLVMVVLCLGLGLFILYAILFIAPGRNSWAGLVLGVVLVIGGLTAAGNFAPYFAISWDGEGITGPQGYVWMPGRRPVTLPWSSLTGVGQTGMGMLFVEDGQGRRILWNQFYGGFVDLMRAVEERCPHLFAGEDETPD